MNAKLSRSRTNMIAAFEQQYRASTIEHAMLLNSFGELVVKHTGDSDEVKFTGSELERACMGLLTHNHPHSMPPSLNDLIVAAKYGLTLRAVGVTLEGQHIDYTVKMTSPSAVLASRIYGQYDNEVEKAEIELARRSWNDIQWEREARNLAVSRLAERLGFSYTRDVMSSIAEMRTSPNEEKRLDLLDSVAPIISREVFHPVLEQLSQLLLRNVNARGVIPVERLQAIRRAAELIVTRAMLGKPAQDGAFRPYTVHHGGHIVPDSPYFASLWRLVRRSAQLATDYHANMMRERLPDDVKRHFELATISPFTDQVSEMDDGLPKLAYDPLRRWLDGKTLSDRIWNAAGNMRARLDEYLAAAISTGKPVAQMTGELQEFLLPGNGTYEAMRLARTEVAAAYSLADFTAAQLNPLVDTYSPYTAPEHQCCDNCDVEEANGPYLKSDPGHLPPFHPMCICSVRWHEVQAPSIIERLRKQIEKGLSAATKSIADLIGPLSKRFVDLMFGERK